MTGGFTTVFEEIILIALLGSLDALRRDRAGAIASPARPRSCCGARCGAMLMAGAANLMTIFLGLELLSLALYCLCGTGRSQDGARIGAEVSDPLLDGVGIFALRHGAAVRRERERDARRFRESRARRAIRCFWMGAGLFLDRHRVQAESRAVSRLGARRLRRRAAAGHRVHERRNQSRRRSRCSRASSMRRCRPASRSVCCLPIWIVAGDLDDRRQRRHARATRSQAPARVFRHRAGRLHS